MKRVLTVLACVLLVGALAFTAIAALTDSTVALTPSATELHRGETFTVDAVLDNAEKIGLGTVALQYDDAVFELTGIACHVEGTMLNLDTPAVLQGLIAKKAATFVLQQTRVVSGKIFTFTFRVKDNVAFGQHKVDVLAASIGEKSGTQIEGTGATVNVVCAHSWSAWSKVSDSQHSRTCQVAGCGKTETAAHAYNNGEVTKQPTCVATGIKTYTCATCNGTKEETVAKSTTHTWETKWTDKDDTNHERACTVAGCTAKETEAHAYNNGEVTKQPTCVATGIKTYTCATCNGTKEETVAKSTTHTWGEWTKADDNKHERVCTVTGCTAKETEDHAWNNGEVTTQPSHTEPGIKTYTCSVCKGTREESVPKTTEHIWGEWTKVDNDKHQRICIATGCDGKETADHAWNNGEVTKAATCVETGIKTYTCSVCKGTKEETIEKSAVHTWGEWAKQDDNKHVKACTVTGCTAKETEDHAWNNGEVTKAATCVETGIKTYTCSVCKGTKEETIEKSAVHTWGEWTKQDDDKHVKACTVTGCAAKETEDHAWNNGEVTKAATCVETGIKTYTCSVCKGTKEETIEKSAVHTWGEWTKADDDKHERACTVTGCTAKETEDHAWNNGEVTKAATCVETGIKTYTCSVCKGTKEETIEKSAVHTWGEWTKVDETNHERTCTVSGCTAKETGAHTVGGNVVVTPPTCTLEGMTTYDCAVCAANCTKDITSAIGHKLVDGKCENCGTTTYSKLISSATNLYRGDTFTVELNLVNDKEINLCTTYLTYDESVFKLVGGTCHITAATLGQVLPEQNVGTCMLPGAAVLSGKVFTFEFEVLKDAVYGEYTIEQRTATGDGKGDYIPTMDCKINVCCAHVYGAWATVNETTRKRVCTDCGAEELGYVAADGVIYNQDKTELLDAPETLTYVVLPESLKVIREDAFEGCEVKTVFFEGAADQAIENKDALDATWHYEVQAVSFGGNDCWICGECEKCYLTSGEVAKATVTFQYEDGTVIASAEYTYGQTVVAPEDVKVPDALADTHVFDGWNAEIVPCTDTAVYTAVFKSKAIPGDIDGNEQVNTDDVIQLLLHVSMPDAFSINGEADFTCDGFITTDDVIQLLLHVSMPDAFPLFTKKV